MSRENDKDNPDNFLKKKKVGLNDEIESIVPYKFRPFLIHLNIAPFFIGYLVWFIIWAQKFGIEEYPELGMIITAVIAILQVLTCLFCYWFVEFRVLMQCSRMSDPEKAEVVKVTPTENNGFAELVYLHHKFILRDPNQPPVKTTWFLFQKTKYLFDTDKKQFKPLEFPLNHSLAFYMESKGYSQSEQQIQDAVSYFDLNKMVMDIPKFVELFIERATAPFFVFQVFCVLLWCLDEYWYYSVFTLFMLVSFECTLVQQQLKNMQMIRQMGNKPFKILVYRLRKWVRINSDELVPGDIVSVSRNFGLNNTTSSTNNTLVNSNTQNYSLPCDILLLRGQCIVNESMLTGESVPVIKEPVESRNDLKDMFDIDNDGKLHVLCGGTVIVQHTPPPKNDSGLRAQDNGCIGYVLRTGFNTSQGKLLRTIMYSVKRVTANNLETFMFILFLLIFAIAASSYVWIEGTKDPSKNRYKLLLECALILTSVIPPELPIELALAVNTSLISLVKLGIYCTEPFRIPFAGKIDICCFDKTGTLTSDDLLVEGVAGIDDKMDIVSVKDLPLETLHTLATCQTLMNLDDELIGDPLEKVTLQAIDWTLTKGDVVIAKKPKAITDGSQVKSSAMGWKIYQRFYFSSALKRMSVIAGHTKPGSVETSYIATCKGAPEVLKPMIKDVPSNFDSIYLHYAREGARVLCLGYKELGNLTHQQTREMTREQVESDLKFAGFVVFSSPLKPDSKSVIKEIMNASHHITMITGDNPLTACHVAAKLRLTDKKNAFVLTRKDEISDEWFWQSILDEKNVKPIEFANQKQKYVPPSRLKESEDLVYHYLCLTGEGFDYMYKNQLVLLKKIIPEVKVFARVSPKQKEQVITMLKNLGFVTLMCGDGTNDVGALKHADVGVALLANSNANSNAEYEQKKRAKINEAQQLSMEVNTNRMRASPNNFNSQAPVINAQKKLAEVLKELEEAEEAQIVKLGDASIASPFTYKQSSIQCVCDIIKQGRCTLVTTLQMFKILALNALILAYSQSVLYLDGIKLSDGQATMQGLLLAGCFLFISRSKPLKNLSKTRPLPNIFNLYTILTVLGQFAVHLGCLIYLVNEAKSRSPPREEKFADLESEFKPSLLNSTVYIISLSLQVATFAINYKGHPFMESLKENKPLLYSIMFSAGAVFVLAGRLMPELSDQFQIVDFSEEYRKILLIVILLDFCASYILDRILEFLFVMEKKNINSQDVEKEKLGNSKENIAKNESLKSPLEDFNNLVNSLNPQKNSYHLTRVVLVRFLAFLYAVAFLVAFNQNKNLLGKNGLLPANKYMDRIYKNFKPQFNMLNGTISDQLWKKLDLFSKIPTLFWFFNWSKNIDLLLDYTSLIGLSVSSIILISGSANSILFVFLWILYHSIVNIGQTWYSFGWESQVLESGFIAIFLVPFFSLKKINSKSPPSFVAIILYRWLIFRIMIGAGLIKLRGDKCWIDLTCMNYFYETQPVPNPLSFYLHKEPESIHKFEVLSNHFIELIAPFLVLMPFRPMRLVGGAIQIIFQAVLILSGNLSFLNWLTILPAIACFDDFSLKFLFNRKRGSTMWNVLKIQHMEKCKNSAQVKVINKGQSIKRRMRQTIDLLVLASICYLSMPVIMNLISEKQAMNTSFEPFRIVNTYGAFGSVTKERYEVIFKGTNAKYFDDPKTEWLEYEFKCKPGDINRRPCFISPYHYRLDWLMWFAAFQSYEYNPWLLSLSAKLLKNDKNFTTQMIASNPFENLEPPKYIKADLYLYNYAEINESISAWWKRKYVKSYIPTISMRNIDHFIKELEWDY
ncbi:unnamed protein product [Brachionus calyciflorus]|uniref:Lipase maturation factor n=1 Tax=Brachionus calyciflorus TaxID=104777 RepID=A0A813M9S7_9BILA|nr:unnamed protein product [Brachionus calyciflorus]